MPESSSDPTTLLFAQYVQRIEAGEQVDFGDYCQAHSAHADGLCNLKTNYDQLVEALRHVRPSGTISEQIKDKYGDEADPNIILKGEEEGSTDLSQDVITRLSSRGKGYGRYRLKGEIDRGGQGAILRVWDEDLRRNLAMKIMLGQVDAPPSGETPPVDSKTLGRFLEEAQVTGQLDHPGIVPVHELGLDADGRVYFTMKLVKGESLAVIFEKVKTGEDGWNQTRALGVLLKVCEAMAYAHDKGVIHRDLKPANIMVGRFGEVYVMDWGLARVLGKEDRKDIRIQPQATTEELRSERREYGEKPDSPIMTIEGDVLGTPSYMSPEQARGELEQVGPQADVYSIGAILYELLAGHMPYVKPGMKASPYTILRWVQEGPPHLLSDQARRASMELIAVCEKAMCRELNERYVSINDIADDLRAFLEGRVVVAHRTGAIVELSKWARRNRSLAAALALLVGGAVGITWVEHRGRVIAEQERERARDAEALAQASERSATQLQGEAQQQRVQARYQSYLANLQAAQALLRTQEPVEARGMLAACPQEYRGWEWLHLGLLTDQSVLSVPLERPVRKVSFSADGEEVFADELRIQLGPEPVVERVVPGLNQRLLAISPDRELAAYAVWDEDRSLGLNVVDLGSDRVLLALSRSGRRVEADLFPDEMLVAVSGRLEGDPLAEVYDIGTGERTLALRSLWASRSGSLSFHPGERLLAVAAAPSVLILDPATGLSEHMGPRARSVGFSPSGRLLGLADGQVVRLLGTEGWPTLLESRLDSEVTCLAIDPHDRYLAVGDEKGRITMVPLDGRSRTSLLGHERGVLSLAFDPTGMLLASSADDRTVRIWNVDDSPARAIGPTQAGHDFAFLGDNVLTDTVADQLFGEPDSIALLEMDTGKVLRVTAFPSDVVTIAAQASGGKAAVGLSDGQVILFDPASGEVVWTGRHGGRLVDLAISPCGQEVAGSSKDGHVFVRRLEDGVVEAELTGDSKASFDFRFGDGALSWSPDGHTLAIAANGSSVALWQYRVGSVRTLRYEADRFVRENSHAGALAFHPDGKRLFFGSGIGEIVCWSVNTGDLLARWQGHRAQVEHLEAFPDGRRIVGCARDGVVRLWNADNYDLLLTKQGSARFAPAVARPSPDGRRIVFAGRYLEVWMSEKPEPSSSPTTRQVCQLVDSLFSKLRYSPRVADVIDRSSLRGWAKKDARRQVSLRAGFYDDPDVLRGAGWSIARNQALQRIDYVRALNWVEASAEMVPGDVDTTLTLAALRVRIGDLAAAYGMLQSVEAGLELAVDSRRRVKTLFLMSICQSQLEMRDVALAKFRSASALMAEEDQDVAWLRDEAAMLLGLGGESGGVMPDRR